ncbi:hypothetical protein ACFSX9_04475 [Flavobacterium ardleyense]|uniref:Lipoprotein n=1 Tax=Flavobacterium ardleyense TaxID=2038737 RepID=A0ABW5Z562_9FLAO
MKKLLQFLVVLITISGFSQEKLDLKNPYLKAVKIEKIDNSKFDYINDAKISWDFSSVDLKNKEVIIEVYSIYDCFNGENANDFKSQFSILNKDNFSVKGSYQLNHFEVMAKCFKYRVVVKEVNKEQASDWSYFMFLK